MQYMILAIQFVRTFSLNAEFLDDLQILKSQNFINIRLVFSQLTNH